MSVDDVLEAVEHGRIEVVKSALAAGLDVDSIGTEVRGRTSLLTTAILELQPAIVRLLVERGAAVEAPDGEGRLPLGCLVERDRDDAAARGLTMHDVVDLILLLLGAGATFRAKGPGGDRVWQHATRSKENLRFIQAWALRQTGGDAAKAAKLIGMTQHQWKLFGGMVERWEARNAEAGVPAGDQTTLPPSRDESLPRELGRIESLIETRVKEAQHVAEAIGSPVLITMSADEMRARIRPSPLADAVVAGDRMAIRRCLGDGADPYDRIMTQWLFDSRASVVWSAYAVAAGYGQLASLEELWAWQTPDGETQQEALAAASFHGHVEIVRWLLARGVPALSNLANISRPAIGAAAQAGHVDIMRVLFDAGAEPDDGDGDGYYPLHEAVMNGHVDAVRLLLERGASIRVKNNDGDTVASRNCDQYEGGDKAERKRAIKQLLAEARASKRRTSPRPRGPRNG